MLNEKILNGEELLDSIFGKCDTEKKLQVNKMLKGLYTNTEYVNIALLRYGLSIPADSYERLIILVTKVRVGFDPVYFDIDGSKLIKYWYADDFTGDRCRCVRISTKEKWDKVVNFMADQFHVDRRYGIIRAGIRDFQSPDIYLFSPIKFEDTCDDPKSSDHGAVMTRTHLCVQSYSIIKERASRCLEAIEKGEDDQITGIAE